MKTAHTTIKLTDDRDFGALFWLSLGYLPTDRLCVVVIGSTSGDLVGSMASAELFADDQDWATLIHQLVGPTPGVKLAVCGFVDEAHKARFVAGLRSVVSAAASCGSRVVSALEVLDEQWTPVRVTPHAACGSRAALPRPVAQWCDTEVYRALVHHYGEPLFNEADVRATVAPSIANGDISASFTLEVDMYAEFLSDDAKRSVTLRAGWDAWIDALAGGPIEPCTVACLSQPTFRDALLLSGLPRARSAGGDVVEGRYSSTVSKALRGMFTADGPRPDHEVAQGVIDTLTRIVTLSSGRERGYVLATLGILYWWTGHGVRARMVAEEARTVVGAQEQLVLLECLEEVCARMVPPGWAQP